MDGVTSDLNSLSLSFVESVYEQYQKDPDSVSPEWQAYFRSQNGGSAPLPEARISPLDGHSRLAAIPIQSTTVRGEEIAALQHRVERLIRSYRARGHRIAKIDPLDRPRGPMRELDPEYHGLTEQHMDMPFNCGTLAPSETLTLREIVERLKQTYCQSIGVQFMHIDDLNVREWLQDRIERMQLQSQLSRKVQLRILTRLTDATIFEEFIQKKYIGAKSFSLEGGESLIPLLELAIEEAGEQGINEVGIGMAHRGRLNVLANIMGKSPRLIFREFEDLDAEKNVGRGDVKYHLGYHNDWITSCGHSVHLALSFNPSHLEFVNPVVLGRLRAKQDRLHDTNRERYMALLIHGDAAFAGEGIVQETLNLSELKGYTTGGTLHVILNNQIGFTTEPDDGRSGIYATAVAKMLQSPIFHVNGEDPEAVARVVKVAMEFRKMFRRDVAIDMYCYRRRGHNEGDEPSFTQPLMYKIIEKRKTVREGYLEHLLKLDEVTQKEAEVIAEKRRKYLEDELSDIRSEDPTVRPSILGRVWKAYRGGPDKDTPEADTSIDRTRAMQLLEKVNTVPAGFTVHPKLERVLEQRRLMGRGEKPMDWASAEALAFAALLTEGTRIRMTGQDSQRGTFSHRHAVLHDWNTGKTHMPLAHIDREQAPIEIHNSPLSETAVLGFEYGYSIAYPDGLVIWEAQFGDFVNVAQVIIDQFLTSAEDKWRSLSGLVLMLPHGFEGMGPEHSSARLERFLTLTAEDNIQVVNCSTPAQYYHCLRRQVLRPWRKPLIMMTPKSLLRHAECVSPLDDFVSGSFQRIIPDTSVAPAEVRKVLMCSGKVYYDLVEERKNLGRKDVAIIRVEQLYPLSDAQLEQVLSPYHVKTPVVWVQEEPGNMGAWRYFRARAGFMLLDRYPFYGVHRPFSASPATGSHQSHKSEQRNIMRLAFQDI